MKLIETIDEFTVAEDNIRNGFLIIQIHYTDVEHIARCLTKAADEETEKSKGFFTKNAGRYNNIAQKCEKFASSFRKKSF